MKEKPVRISARNQFRGAVVSIGQGAVNGIIQAEVTSGLIISSSITNEAIQDLGLGVDGEVITLVGVFSVMVGMQD